eukprot:CAMPEP_0195568392 /NCGR_PEP_ID=MMETSP0814-20130614/2214_1 /TAXON_ID=97485 /ORGANISM="Prymnesium parvum, Strain Texoma1" /LENGTH=76 /DNA_ID=CAMNT_0040703687 /DNA_START=271 /DNA_END=497 /DNA_ORIENTATION=+
MWKDHPARGSNASKGPQRERVIAQPARATKEARRRKAEVEWGRAGGGVRRMTWREGRRELNAGGVRPQREGSDGAS